MDAQRPRDLVLLIIKRCNYQGELSNISAQKNTGAQARSTLIELKRIDTLPFRLPAQTTWHERLHYALVGKIHLLYSGPRREEPTSSSVLRSAP